MKGSTRNVRSYTATIDPAANATCMYRPMTPLPVKILIIWTLECLIVGSSPPATISSMTRQIPDTSSLPPAKSKATVVQQRVIIGAILIVLVVTLFWLDGFLSTLVSGAAPATRWVNWKGLLLNGGLITLVAAVLVLATAQEMVEFCRSAGMRPAALLVTFFAPVLAIHPWVAMNVSGLGTDSLALIILVLALVGSVLAIMARRQTDGAIQDIATTWLSASYIGLLASFLIRIRQEVPGSLGAWVVLWVIAVVKFTDIFAYGTGMLVGRHKLIPWLSPGKTWEGLAGGLAGAGLIAMLLLYGSVIIGIDGIGHDIGPGTYLGVGLIGILLGGIGQLGDLMESLLKRGAKRKDSASLLPGFGGVFDLLDSPLLAAPAAWAFIRLFQHLSLIGTAAN